MALIDKTISGLYGGVSQQAITNIRDEQCLEQTNCYSTVVGGLRKRPPMRVPNSVSENFGSAHKDAYFTSVPTTNGYVDVAILSASASPVIAIIEDDNVSVVTNNTGSYLSTFTGSTSIKSTGIEDGILLVNTDTIVQKKAGAGDIEYHYWTMWIRESTATPTTFTVEDVTYTSTANEPLASIASNIALALNTAGLGGGSGWVADGEFVLYKGKDISFTSSDSNGNSSHSSWLYSVESITDLPKNSFPYNPEYTGEYYEPVIKIEGLSLDESYYYARFNRATSTWVEAVGWGKDNNSNSSITNAYEFRQDTMPVILKKVGTSWICEYIDYSKMIVGDKDLTPPPSIIGNKISDMVVYQDRLCLVGGNSIVLSNTGDYTNFFPSTVRSVPATDTIDTKMPSATEASIRHVVPYNKDLMLFSDDGQYILSSGDNALAPTTVYIDKVSNYRTSKLCKPALSDTSLFFSNNGTYSSVKQFAVIDNKSSYRAHELTEHVPTYLPSEFKQMETFETTNTLVCLPYNPTDPSEFFGNRVYELYIYTYFLSQQGRIQSSWSKWVFPTGIKSISSKDNKLVLYMYLDDLATSTDTCIHEIDMSLLGAPITEDYTDSYSYGSVLGYPIESSYTAKPWTLDATKSGVDNTRGRLTIRTLKVNASDNSDYELEVTTTNNSRTINGADLKDSKATIGSKSDGVDIKIVNTTNTGFQINSLSYEGTYFSRSRNLKGN